MNLRGLKYTKQLLDEIIVKPRINKEMPNQKSAAR